MAQPAAGVVIDSAALARWAAYTQRLAGLERSDIRRLSPLVVEHINLAGRYQLVLADRILRGEYRALKKPEDAACVA